MNQEATGWHLDKKVPITILLMLCTQFVGGLWVLAEMRKDIDVLKTQMSTQRDRDDRQDKQQQDATNLLRSQLERIESKLDRLVEKGR